MRGILFFGGAAALGWQVVWAHQLGLALGASARGVALTVATAMAGMTLGAILAAHRLRKNPPTSPLRCYGLLELAIGVLALLPGLAQSGIMALDATIHQHHPGWATPFSALALALTLGPACAAMGATVPVFGLLARQIRRPLSALYGANTAGAAAGALLTAFLLIPSLDLGGTVWALAGTHFSLAAFCLLSGKSGSTLPSDLASEGRSRNTVPGAGGIALATGAAAFLLEVAWFRSLRAAWFSTSDSLAAMLFCFLVALAVGAWLAPVLQGKRVPLWIPLLAGALATVLATPLLGSFDTVDLFQSKGAMRQVWRVLGGLLVMGPPVVLLGVALPSLLNEGRTPRDWAGLYAWNTVGAVVGANAAAWFLMPWLGPLGTAWLAAAVLAGAAALARGRSHLLAGVALLIAALAILQPGENRVPGASRSFAGAIELIERRHGPDATISVVEFTGGRALMIDGFATTADSPDPRFLYMDAMGRVPMLLHPDPKDALVICYGTGRTARAVLDEDPQALDLVDLNAAVFDMARHFPSGTGVLEDPRSRIAVMDGRAWLRRTKKAYDVITLEPMPPFFSGSNSLYSREFYTLAASRLRKGGIMAQWFPMHLMTPGQARAVAASFVAAFPDAILWLDPGSLSPDGLPDQGILLGRTGDGGPPLGEDWPGFSRPHKAGARPLASFDTRSQVALDPEALRRYAAAAEPVSDDNRLLEYGGSLFREKDLPAAASIRRIHEEMAAAR